MDRHHVALALVGALALTAGCSFFASNPDSYTSTYEYDIGIDTNATLENATVRVPLPQFGGTPAVNASVVAPNGTVESSVDAAVVETAYGPMLELTADRFAVTTRYYRFVESNGTGYREEISREQYDADDPDHQRVDHRSISVSVSVAAEYPLETRAPVGTEPTFYADDAVTRELRECRVPDERAEACFGYDAPVYLTYEGAGNASVRGFAAVSGSNEWFAGGWTSNSYTDRVRFDASGPQQGWRNATGSTVTGQGSYPSPS